MKEMAATLRAVLGQPPVWAKRPVVWLRENGLLLLAVVAAILFRLPPLLHARELDADSAILSLQAVHMMHGEWSLLLWGSPYQASFEAAQCALFYEIFGVHPPVFVSVAIFDHLVVLLLTHAMLRRRVSKWASFVLILPLVLSPLAVQFWTYRPCRQFSITLAMLSIYLLDGVGERATTRRITAFLGGVVALLACFQDAFCWVMLPAPLVMSVLTPYYERRITKPRWSWAACSTAGLAVGYGLYKSLLVAGGEVRKVEALSFDRLSRNIGILSNHALAWSFGYSPASELYRVHGHEVVWHAPHDLVPILHVGAWTIAAIVVGATFVGLVSNDPPETRKLVLVGLTLIAANLGGGLVADMVFNQTAWRYFAPVILALPFVGVGLVRKSGALTYLLLTLPMIITFTVSGWVHYTSWVDGFRIRTGMDGFNDDERAVGLAMKARGIRYGASGYWTAYQLMYMFDEQVIIAPTSSNRYPPYGEAFTAAKKVAYIEDSDGPLKPPPEIPILSQETQRIGIYTVTFVERK